MDHPEAGGAEVVCQELAARFAAQGFDVVLLCAAVAGRPRHEQRDGYRIVRGGGRFTVYAVALWWLLWHRRSVGGVLDSQNGIPFFTPLAVRRRTPVVMLLHHIHQEQFSAYFPRPVAAFGRWLEGPVSRRVYGRRAIVAVSPSTRTGARRQLRLRGDIWVAPPGWSVTPVDVPRTEYPSVVCVGRLVPHKRTDLVVSAFPGVLAAHRDARLVVVGRGPERARLIALAESLGIAGQVDFRDDLDDAGRDQVLAAAWMSVNASAGEGWGLSVVEANALGVPVLAYRRPGLRDSIVDATTGWLVEDDANLSAEIADRLTELGSPHRAERYAADAREWAGNFTWATMTGRVEVALHAEELRLARGRKDQRHLSDAAVAATVPVELMPDDWQVLLRQTDSWQVDDAHVTVLLRGADLDAAHVALSRWGVEPAAAGVTLEVARTADLLRLRPAARDHV
nr:glycosyltransferase family 4 protein [Cellulomonas humilata]